MTQKPENKKKNFAGCIETHKLIPMSRTSFCAFHYAVCEYFDKITCRPSAGYRHPGQYLLRQKVTFTLSHTQAPTLEQSF